VTERVQGLLSAQAAGRGVKLRFDAEPDITCHGDGGQLTQVLLNIVLNAVQACRKGDEVRVECMTDAGGAASAASVARIEVTDTGPGIPAEIRDSLFEPFVTTKTRGTGLGLAICQQIIEEHEGTLRVDFLERGTRFSLELPLKL
jgi:signal transduction histidine kinase